MSREKAASRAALSLSLVAVPACAVASLAVFLTVALIAAGLGSHLPPAHVRGADPLDYARRVVQVAPLEGRFIRDALGNLIALPATRAPLVRDETRAAIRAQPVSTGLGPPRLVEHHELTNDHLGDAWQIASVPFTARTNSRTATRTSEDPVDCSQTGPTIWYRYRPGRDRRLVASTVGSDHGVALGVFETAGSERKQVACHTDVRGNALVTFVARAGHTYLFQLSGVGGGGNVVFNLDGYGTIRRVSAGPRGEPSDGPSAHPAISRDGRYVVFTASVTNFVPGDGPEDAPCYERGPPSSGDALAPCGLAWLRDMHSGAMEIVSISTSGEIANESTTDAYVSADGRYVVFSTTATNLVPDDPPGRDLFVRDRATRRTERVPLPPPAEPYADESGNPLFPTISDDGRHVAFQTSRAVAPGDTNKVSDVYVHDRWTRGFERASVSSSGALHVERQYGTTANSEFLSPYISGNGRFVVFQTDDPLVSRDNNGFSDVFVHDRLTQTTERVSSTENGEAGNDGATSSYDTGPLISADGRYVAFASFASDLVPEDAGNVRGDCFVRDRLEGTTKRLSGGESDVISCFISEDGRFVVADEHPLLVGQVGPSALPVGNERRPDIYRYDRLTGTKMVVTLPSGDAEAWGSYCQISGDGGHVVFVSNAESLQGATNGNLNVFVYSAAM